MNTQRDRARDRDRNADFLFLFFIMFGLGGKRNERGRVCDPIHFSF